MSNETQRPLLIVEDDPALQKQMRWAFDQYETLTAGDRESALAQVRRHAPPVVTMDLGLPPDPDSASEGFRLLEQILAMAPDTKVIVLTGQNDRANALRAIGLGAYDFFAKPFEPELLGLTIDRAFRLHDLQQENRRLQSMRQPDALSGLITRDPEVLRVCRTDREGRRRQRHRAGPGRERHRQGTAGPRACTSSRRAATSDSSPSTVPRFPRTCWKANSSATRRARSPAPPRPTPGKIETADNGHADAGRNRRSAAGAAGQAAALPAGARHRARRRAAGDPGRCAHRLRHAPGPEGADQGGHASARISTTGWPKSSSRFRRCARASAMPRCSRMPSCSALPQEQNRGTMTLRADAVRGDRGAPLARQRPRARELHQARGDHGRWQPDRRRRCRSGQRVGGRSVAPSTCGRFATKPKSGR